MRWLEAATTQGDIVRLLAKHGLAPQPPPEPRARVRFGGATASALGRRALSDSCMSRKWDGKRTASASVRIAVGMVHEGLLHQDEAILRIEPERLQELLFPANDPKAGAKPIARGIAASPGAVSGKAVFSADEAERLAHGGDAVLLIRAEISGTWGAHFATNRGFKVSE